jgi:hypothetical protein
VWAPSMKFNQVHYFRDGESRWKNTTSSLCTHLMYFVHCVQRTNKNFNFLSLYPPSGDRLFDPMILFVCCVVVHIWSVIWIYWSNSLMHMAIDFQHLSINAYAGVMIVREFNFCQKDWFFSLPPCPECLLGELHLQIPYTPSRDGA